jgi:hypothetical protein
MTTIRLRIPEVSASKLLECASKLDFLLGCRKSEFKNDQFWCRASHSVLVVASVQAEYGIAS